MAGCDIGLIESVGARWDWFCSFTVAERNIHPVRLRRAFEGWKARLANKQGKPSRLIFHGLRIECGEDVVHVHCHALIGGLRQIDTLARFIAMREWEVVCFPFAKRAQGSGSTTENSLGGTARIRVYDPSAGAAGYLSKQLNASELWGWLNSEIELCPRAYEVAHQMRLKGLVSNAPEYSFLP